MQNNGRVSEDGIAMDVHTKLDVLLQGLAELSEQVAEIATQQAELIEKLANLDLAGADYGVEEFDS